MPFWGSPTWLLPTASRRLLGSRCKNSSQDPSGFKTKEFLKDSHTSQLRMFLQRCAFGQGKEEHSGPICALCPCIKAPSKQGELSLLVDVETSSQSESLTAKCTQTIWITQWKLVTTNWYHSEKSHEMQKIKTTTTPCCLKLFNFGGSFLRIQASRSNVFPPRHPRNDAFLRFTHLASPSCFHASAGIL